MVFENTATRSVPIRPVVDGKPAAGYMIGNSTADPPNAEVVGPETAVGRVTEAITEPVSIAGARDRVQETVTIGTLDPELRLKTLRTAIVTVQIVPAPIEHTFRGRPIHFRNLAPNLTAIAVPLEVDVTLRGNMEALSRVELDDVMAYVDLAGLGPGHYMFTVRADSASDAGVTRIEPSKVQVRITSAQN